MKFPEQPTGLQDMPGFARDLRNYLRSITLRPSKTVRVTVTANGTTLEAVNAGGSSTIKARSDPWTLTGSVESGPAATIYVAPGMVNNYIPTISVGGTPTSIATVPSPGLVVTGSSGSVYLKATVDTSGAITALVIESASSVPVDTSTEKHKLLGTWTASGGAFTSVVSILNANQTLYICNGTAIWEA